VNLQDHDQVKETIYEIQVEQFSGPIGAEMGVLDALGHGQVWSYSKLYFQI
jgi:hypothetical protein